MPFNYVSVEEGAAAPGLRMVVVSGVPSPWGEAAKGIFHVKGLDWKAVRLAYDDPDLATWTRQDLSGPIAFYNDEPPRSGWSDIIHLAERLAPSPSLLPSDAGERALTFGLCHELVGEGGLLWTRRLQLVEWGLAGKKGFSPPVSQYLGGKYGYQEGSSKQYANRTLSLLSLFAGRLIQQKKAGHRFYMGAEISALDIYSAAGMALFCPLDEEKCAFKPGLREAFSTLDEKTANGLDPILIEHRDMMYSEFLETPLSL
ncbi:MAG: hypothetical protein AAF986_03150 [Pseudomonadota bacterium]